MRKTLQEAIEKVRKKRKNTRGISYVYYREYINSSYWKEKRDCKLILKPICECCWLQSEHIHHETYHRLWKEKMSDLRSLCWECHKNIHFIYNEWKNTKKTLSSAFFRLRKDLWVFPYWKSGKLEIWTESNIL